MMNSYYNKYKLLYSSLFLLLCLLFCFNNFVQSQDEGGILPPPSPTTLPNGMTPGTFPSPPETPALQLVPPPPPAQPTSIPPEQFPLDAPKPPPSDVPPPLAPSGRWLHSAVLIDGKMYVFGGVGSYSTALYNDLWLYNFAERSFTELQASFVPPFPVESRNNPNVREPKGTISMFRPNDAPPQPPMRTEPENKPVFAPIPADNAVGNPFMTSNLDPVYRAPKTKPMPIENYQTPPYFGDKAAGYSFIETQSIQYQRFQQAVANIVAASSYGTRHNIMNDFKYKLSSKKQKKAMKRLLKKQRRNMIPTDISMLETLAGTHELSMQTPPGAGAPNAPGAAAPTAAGQEPARFWKSDSLAPTLMSPFIAADLWGYDLETKLWQNIKSNSRDIPAPRWLHSAVAVNGRMIIFGGVSYSDTILGDVWVFNPKDASWIKSNPRGDPILPREGHSAVLMAKSSMYVFGGISYGHIPFNDLWMYDATRNAWLLQQTKGNAPPPRWLHTAAVHVDGAGAERMFVFGGVTRNFVPLDDLWVLDQKTLTWSHPKASGYPPFPRMLHTAEICHDSLVVLGGIANNIPLEDVWVYDIVGGTWNEEYPDGPYPFAREGASIVKISPAAPEYEPQEREPWVPPPPKRDADEFSAESLMPLIRNTTTPRPLNRFRKEFNMNRFLLIFGGAGPKPQQ